MESARIEGGQAATVARRMVVGEKGELVRWAMTPTAICWPAARGPK